MNKCDAVREHFFCVCYILYTSKAKQNVVEWRVNYKVKSDREKGKRVREADGDGKNGNGTGKRAESTTDNRALVSWRKLKCRWLGILLSLHTSLPFLKDASLILLSSYFSLTFLFQPFLSLYLSLQFPFILYISYNILCTPIFISTTLSRPCSCLSLRSKLHVAMNSLPELCTLRCSSNPWPEEGRSLYLDLITSPASGYDTLERDSHDCTLVKKNS